jgi:hypothetical protein
MEIAPAIIHGHNKRFQLCIIEEFVDDSANTKRVICIWDTLNECRVGIPQDGDKKRNVGELFDLFKHHCNELNNEHEDRLKYEKEISNFTGMTIFIQG